MHRESIYLQGPERGPFDYDWAGADSVMGDFVQWLEGTAVATFVRESPSIFAYTSVLSLHAMGLAVVVGVGAAVSLRLLGLARGIPLAPLLKLYPVMWIGFTVNAISGLALLAASASTMLANVVFLVKLALIAVALVNMELLRHRITVDAASGTDVAAPQTRALAVGALVLWAAVIIAGRLTAYPNFVTSLFG